MQFQDTQTNKNGFLTIFTFVISVEKRKEPSGNIDSFDIKCDFIFPRMETDLQIPKKLMLTLFKCLHFSITYAITKCFDVGKSNINYSTPFYFCWLVRGSLFIELGCTRDLGKGWRGDLGTFMISRSI